MVMSQEQIIIEKIQNTKIQKQRSWDEDSPSNADGTNDDDHLCKPLATRGGFIYDENNGGGRRRRPKRRPKLKESSYLAGPM